MKSKSRLALLFVFLAASLGATISDQPIADYQKELLDLAFKTASNIPTDPHIKTRCREQEKVVSASIELGQPSIALAQIEKIENWRRGASYADLAFYCAEKGEKSEVARYLRLAEEVANTTEDWRKDRIRVKIAKTHALQGDHKMAAAYESGVVDSETGKVDRVRAQFRDEKTFDSHLKALENAVSIKNFDILKNWLQACVELFDSFYGDEKRRTIVEKKIKESWDLMPINIRIDLLMEMTDSSLNHKDLAKAQEFLKETQAMIGGSRWIAEDKIIVIAKLAKLKHRAGDSKQAKEDLDKAMELFANEQLRIVDIYRAGALRPVAEAYQLLGEHGQALAVYKMAALEGVENPNSRPRAEDLVATCLSLILNRCEPDKELRERLFQIHKGLKDPW